MQTKTSSFCVVAGCPIRNLDSGVVQGPLQCGLVLDVSVLAAVIKGSVYSYSQTTRRYAGSALFDLFVRKIDTGAACVFYAPLDVIESAIVLARGMSPEQEKEWRAELRWSRLRDCADLHPSSFVEVAKIHKYIETGVY